MTKKPRPFPTKQEVIDFIRQSEQLPSKRDIANYFQVKGADERIVLKDMVRDLKKEGLLGAKARELGARKQAEGIQEMEVVGYSPSGHLQAYPIDRATEMRVEDGSKPFLLSFRAGEAPPVPGSRVLVQINAEDEGDRRAKVIRILPERLTHVLGIYRGEGEHGTVEPVSRKVKEIFSVHADHTMGVKDGELVYCQILQGISAGKNRARKESFRQPVKVIERVGRLDAPKSASIIAIHNHDIPMAFSNEAIQIAGQAKAPTLTEGRVDIRDIPLVTIDGADARDFDDAVWAEADTDPKNAGGWHLVVAIADVAHYVHFGSKLDDEAFLRGNSVYFPDRVVPMLPEALSNGLCSLNPNEDRNCLAVHIWIDADGNTLRYQFLRGLMNSRARLTYELVQDAYDGKETTLSAEFIEQTIKPLYGVFASLNKQRVKRGALDLDLPEHKAQIDDATGKVLSIKVRERVDSHKLIEECMIAANVAAAHAIETANAPGMFRVHETPDFERVMDLKTFLKQMGYNIARQEALSAHHFNAVLKDASEKPEAHIIHMAILRTQMAAYYHPKNLGHFGLSLAQYCHFTSPIRRYSDLIVHRTLIDIFRMCDQERDGLKFEQAENLNAISTHISHTERRAMMAEREANDRYVAGFMADQIGKEFDAIIATVNSFGFFVEIRETGVQGLVPLRTIGGDFYLFDKEKQRLIGRSTGEVFSMGQKIRVLLVEANTLTGSLQFALQGRQMRGINPTRGGKRDERGHKGRGGHSGHRGSGGGRVDTRDRDAQRHPRREETASKPTENSARPTERSAKWEDYDSSPTKQPYRHNDGGTPSRNGGGGGRGKPKFGGKSSGAKFGGKKGKR